MPAESARIEEIVAEALSKGDGEARQRYLLEVCGDDGQLKQSVEVLLEAREARFNAESPASNTIHATPHLPTGERPGSVIGRFKLIEPLGEGGFGVVYLASQQEPVRRLVALKVIKSGMDTRHVVARFEAERQALAMMDHPNIARVLDAGTTDAGQPYFVMELVDGAPITKFSDEYNLDIRQRLELFGQVAQAVQHAHHKGLIHRDIKPTNVLAMMQNNRPLVKVIDFGVAKAMAVPLTDKTLVTGLHQMLGTPAYMSPEQAQGQLDVDTRSDVYSRGVLLYELLVSVPPFDPRELRSKSFVEILRIIREVEPPCPSARLTTLADKLPWIAADRSMEPRKLAVMMRGELDWIVMRAIEKDRTRRYQSANSLAEDVERFLREEPVEARPATLTYRLKKFVRRNKVGVFAGATAAAALAVGMALAAMGFVQARRQADVARDEARRATQVQDFLRGMLTSINPDVHTSAAVTVEQMLDRAGAVIDASADMRPEVRAVLQDTLGETFYGLQLYSKARTHFEKAVDVRRRLPHDALGLAAALVNLAKTEVVMSVNDEKTQAYVEEASAIYAAELPESDWRLVYARGLALHAAGKSADRILVDQAVQVLAFISQEQLQQLHVAEAFGRTLAETKALLVAGDHEGATSIMLGYHLANMEKVNKLIAAGDVEAIQRNLHEHLEPFMSVPLVGANTPGGTIVLAKTMQKQGFSPVIVEATLREGIELAREYWQGGEPAYVAVALHDLAVLQRDQGRLAAAEESARDALEMRRKTLGLENPETAKSRDLLIDVLQRADKADEAEKLRNESAPQQAA